MTADRALLPDGYHEFLRDLRERVRSAQVRAGLAVNQELVLLYWGIGNDILRRQQGAKWGDGFLPQLAKDLRIAFPEMKGFSPRNIKYMRDLAEAWPEQPILQQVVAKLPWGHNCTLLDKVKSPEKRIWYARQTIEHGWSRNVLVIQIEAGLHERQGKAITNFQHALPSPQSDLAQQLLKDPTTSIS